MTQWFVPVAKFHSFHFYKNCRFYCMKIFKYLKVDKNGFSVLQKKILLMEKDLHKCGNETNVMQVRLVFIWKASETWVRAWPAPCCSAWPEADCSRPWWTRGPRQTAAPELLLHPLPPGGQLGSALERVQAGSHRLQHTHTHVFLKTQHLHEFTSQTQAEESSVLFPAENHRFDVIVKAEVSVRSCGGSLGSYIYRDPCVFSPQQRRLIISVSSLVLPHQWVKLQICWKVRNCATVPMLRKWNQSQL